LSLPNNPSFVISAGEASGEAHGADLMAAIRRLAPGAQFFGVGGDRMSTAGCDLVVHARDIAVLGLAEVVRHLPRIYGEFRKLLKAVDQRRPAAAILIDFPDFNFRLARQLHRRGIPVFYYISPQLWAWRPGRIHLVRKYIRKMLVIFPFEEPFYRRRQVAAEFVGHPYAELAPPAISRQQFAAQHHLDAEKPWIALLPGSRRKEVSLNLPRMLAAAASLDPGFQFLIPKASTLEVSWLKALHERSPQRNMPLTFTDNSLATLALSRVAVVASGTATLEAALMGVPFVMVYRVAGLTWAVGRRFVDVPHFASVNLIAGREIVPELLQADFTAENVRGQLRELIENTCRRRQMMADFAELRQKLRWAGETTLPAPGELGAAEAKTASQRAAETILSEMGRLE
jgi:lipid-A-disaccharide synthase